jgi:hypothetical protein
MLKKLILALGASTPVLLVGNVLAATLPNLDRGSPFRYVFVTSGTRDATSTNISDYNIFVNNAASAGNETSDIPGTWAAIGSTASISARTNTATTSTVGVPIYRLDGELVANNYADLWDGSIANYINVDENGTVIESIELGPLVWTGSNSDGSTKSSNPLGAFRAGIGTVALDNPGLPDFWINTGSASSGQSLQLYAMSSIQEIPPIPEPTTIIASLLVGAGLLPLKRRKEKTK